MDNNEEIENLLSEPIEGNEEKTGLGVLTYLWTEYRPMFENANVDLIRLENEVSFLIRRGIALRKKEPTISKLDLLAKIEQGDNVHNEALGGLILLHIYKVNHCGNGCSESLGRLTNIICTGARSGLGNKMIEDIIRLHFIPPVETAEFRELLKEIVLLWVQCGGSEAIAQDEKRSLKRKLEKGLRSILPIGSETGSASRRALAKRRKRQERLLPML